MGLSYTRNITNLSRFKHFKLYRFCKSKLIIGLDIPIRIYIILRDRDQARDR